MKLNLGDIRFHLTNHGFLGGEFLQPSQKTKEGEKGTKGFLLEKEWAKSSHNKGKKNLNLPNLENSFPQFTKFVKTKSIGNPFYKK
jgi:hypothetical protein